MEPKLVAKVLSHLEKFVIGEDVQFHDRTEEDFLWLITGDTLFNKIPCPAEWKPWQNGSIEWGASSYSIQRCDFLGQPGVFVWGTKQQLSQATSTLAGLKHSPIRIG